MRMKRWVVYEACQDTSKLVCKQEWEGEKRFFCVCRLFACSFALLHRNIFWHSVFLVLCRIGALSLHCVPIKNTNRLISMLMTRWLTSVCTENMLLLWLYRSAHTIDPNSSVNAFCCCGIVCLRFPNGMFSLSHDATLWRAKLIPQRFKCVIESNFPSRVSGNLFCFVSFAGGLMNNSREKGFTPVVTSSMTAPCVEVTGSARWLGKIDYRVIMTSARVTSDTLLSRYVRS